MKTKVILHETPGSALLQESRPKNGREYALRLVEIFGAEVEYEYEFTTDNEYTKSTGETETATETVCPSDLEPRDTRDTPKYNSFKTIAVEELDILLTGVLSEEDLEKLKGSFEDLKNGTACAMIYNHRSYYNLSSTICAVNSVLSLKKSYDEDSVLNIYYPKKNVSLKGKDDQYCGSIMLPTVGVVDLFKSEYGYYSNYNGREVDGARSTHKDRKPRVDYSFKRREIETGEEGSVGVVNAEGEARKEKRSQTFATLSPRILEHYGEAIMAVIKYKYSGKIMFLMTLLASEDAMKRFNDDESITMLFTELYENDISNFVYVQNLLSLLIHASTPEAFAKKIGRKYADQFITREKLSSMSIKLRGSMEKINNVVSYYVNTYIDKAELDPLYERYNGQIDVAESLSLPGHWYGVIDVSPESYGFEMIDEDDEDGEDSYRSHKVQTDTMLHKMNDRGGYGSTGLDDGLLDEDEMRRVENYLAKYKERQNRWGNETLESSSLMSRDEVIDFSLIVRKYFANKVQQGGTQRYRFMRRR